MPNTKATIALAAILAGVCGPFAAPSTFAASNEKVLYSFNWHGNGYGGYYPNGGLVFDAAGNLYGTTSFGGSECPDGGIVFELTPSADGRWHENVLHDFPCNTSDGFVPNGSLIFDAKGNLYGTTQYGGAYQAHGGTVFQLTRGKNDRWNERVLHSFGDGNDGAVPQAGLILDAAGNLYGTTRYGGAYGMNCQDACGGTVFQLRPGKNGKWTEKVLHNFRSLADPDGGFWPEGPVTMDAVGNLYGTASFGGPHSCQDAYNCGVVFEISPCDSGHWTYRVTHSFDGTDGYWPQSALIFDSAGNLYSTTPVGGDPECSFDGYTMGCGTVFELTPDAGGKWTGKVLRAFHRPRGSPYSNGSGVILDAAGNLYGTTYLGGHYYDCPPHEYCGGTAYKLSPGADGEWTETPLQSFGNGIDGADPSGSLIFDAEGNLYGTTMGGGKHGGGTVFEITP